MTRPFRFMVSAVFLPLAVGVMPASAIETVYPDDPIFEDACRRAIISVGSGSDRPWERLKDGFSVEGVEVAWQPDAEGGWLAIKQATEERVQVRFPQTGNIAPGFYRLSAGFRYEPIEAHSEPGRTSARLAFRPVDLQGQPVGDWELLSIPLPNDFSGGWQEETLRVTLPEGPDIAAYQVWMDITGLAPGIHRFRELAMTEEEG